VDSVGVIPDFHVRLPDSGHKGAADTRSYSRGPTASRGFLLILEHFRSDCSAVSFGTCPT
jgi:hypothetical protein